MIYMVAGLLASALMLLYRRPVASSSPLRQASFDSPMLTARLEGRGARIASGFGLFGSFGVLFVVAALRYGIGTDYWLRNVPLFEQVREGGGDDYEYGFVLINRVIGELTDDYQWLFAAISFLTIALFYRFIVRMSLNPAMSVFLFVFGGFYLEAFNLVRQGLAIAIVLNTIELAMRKRRFRFILCTLLAVSIHSSAFIWFAVWPLMWVRAGRFIRILSTAGIAIVITAVPGLLEQLVRRFAPDYAWYFESNYGVVRSLDPTVFLIAVAVFLASAVLVRRSAAGDRYSDAVVNIQSVNVAILVATVFIAYAFSRLNYYFAPIQVLAVPLILSAIRSRDSRWLFALLLMAGYVVSFYSQFIIWNAHGVMPYDSIFSR